VNAEARIAKSGLSSAEGRKERGEWIKSSVKWARSLTRRRCPIDSRMAGWVNWARVLAFEFVVICIINFIF
jgi:hypothetical protein